jgi:hypothetical protein
VNACRFGEHAKKREENDQRSSMIYEHPWDWMDGENVLDLALDIDNTMGICFGLFEQRACLACQQPYSSVLLF